MAGEFQPSFTNFQQDIEGYLTSIGKREKRKDGLTVFQGYYDAEQMMFQRYLDKGAFGPLVAHFKGWNWDVGYNDYLFELTTALITRPDWSLLQRLWDAVIARRRKLYNQLWKIEKDEPGKLPSKTVTDSKERLLETLERVKAFAEEMGQPDDSARYTEMMGRVQRGRRA